jgi:ribonucleoside-triphosphate reductase
VSEAEIADNEQIDEIVATIEDFIDNEPERKVTVEQIQDLVEEGLVKRGLYRLAKAYIIYRYEHASVREVHNLDDKILSIIAGTDKFSNEENSNKNTFTCSTQRDYAAGEISKDLTFRRLLPKEIADAHAKGILHFHDADYFMQHMFNCCLINMEDVLDNGTCINGKLIESPKSFRVACTVMTQVIANVASNQYGGQSVDLSCLGKYVEVSREKQRQRVRRELDNAGLTSCFVSEEDLTRHVNEIAEMHLQYEIRDGVQTIQYQINTLMTTNGQSPFVTLFMYVRDDDPYKHNVAMVVEEVLRQRIDGIKNEKGVKITPAFPKLVYVLDENNKLDSGEFSYLTELAVECSAKRMYPDYISAKKMREAYKGNVFTPMGCRSFLSPWKDENGNWKFYGRFNQGVVSINLPQIGIIANGDEDVFWRLLEERLLLCREALMYRHRALEGTPSDVSPLHWQYGAISRLEKGEKIDKLLHDGYSTLSLGYIGVYEMTMAMKGVSHTEPEGKEFALRVMKRLKDTVDSWKASTGLGFALYGTPAESLCYRFASIDAEQFGEIKDITDKGYYTNSYHVDVREKINAFDKLKFESEFQRLSPGGCISYIEIPNMEKNLDALRSLVGFIYDTIQYAEFNTRSDYCHVCGFTGEILINDDNQWECPQCGNKDHSKMNVPRRTCGYLGENFWNEGKTKEMKNRTLHL